MTVSHGVRLHRDGDGVDNLRDHILHARWAGCDGDILRGTQGPGSDESRRGLRDIGRFTGFGAGVWGEQRDLPGRA